MCLSSPKPATPPPPPPLPPAPPAPPAPPEPAPAPESLQTEDTQTAIKTKKSKREQQGTVSKGTSQLKISNVNYGGGGSGGLNIAHVRDISELTGDRNEFLNTAEDCARLTLPYLIKPEGDTNTPSLDHTVASSRC